MIEPARITKTDECSYGTPDWRWSAARSLDPQMSETCRSQRLASRGEAVAGAIPVLSPLAPLLRLLLLLQLLLLILLLLYIGHCTQNSTAPKLRFQVLALTVREVPPRNMTVVAIWSKSPSWAMCLDNRSKDICG